MLKARLVMAAVPVVLAAMTGAVAAWGPDPAPAARPFTFGLWGDMPYAKAGDGPKMAALIADMNADQGLGFTAFDGDIKDGASLCDDGQYRAAIDRYAEYRARSAADIAWVRQAFAEAKGTGARAVMIIMQADPGFDLPETPAVNERDNPSVDGYTDLVGALTDETRAFAGEVVLVHGDTHFFKLDKPLVNQAHLIPNFTRLETFGSPNVDWVKVTADPRSRQYFTFEPRVIAANHP